MRTEYMSDEVQAVLEAAVVGLGPEAIHELRRATNTFLRARAAQAE